LQEHIDKYKIKLRKKRRRKEKRRRRESFMREIRNRPRIQHCIALPNLEISTKMQFSSARSLSIV
jgi:hypothetical protein